MIHPEFAEAFPNAKNLHPESACTGNPCVVHHPSNHHMRGWAMTMSHRFPGAIWRQCKHGVWHPDPDSFYAGERLYSGKFDAPIFVWEHTCDGCCCPHGLHIPHATFRYYPCDIMCERWVFGDDELF